MGQHSIDLWVHGHIHECFDYETHGVRVVCNPRGYYNYREAPSFEPDKLISL
jgi:Icc-related predicted phosphoesterase